jgi:para-nitrobenzyl esterase
MNASRTLALALLLAAGSAHAIQVKQGTLEGQRRDGIDRYLGIPYAAAPVGDRRWTAPQPAPAWTGVRHADRFAANCQQAPAPAGFRAWTAEYLIKGDISEDCLYLNVWAPTVAPATATAPAAKPLPVLVWIHGGAFINGGATVPVYDGERLAAKGVIVVTINYRLGVYGFLSHPALRQENPAHASGNYGLLDQVAALRWVRDNIAAFGGDPARVTVAGQSAGAAAVHHLIASPLAKGLFQGAIAESGSGMGLHVPDGAASDAVGVQLAAQAGAPDIGALRRLTPAQLDKAAAALRFGPNVDGLVLPDASYVERNTNDVPMLTGLTADEGSSMADTYGQATPASLAAGIRERYGALAPEFIKLYPAATPEQAGAAQVQLDRDRGVAATWLWAKRRMATSRQPVYLYLFTHVEPGPEAARYGAFHSSEIPYVFETLDKAYRPYTDADRVVAHTTSAYWVSFIETGDPNVTAQATWPRARPVAPLMMEIGDAPRAGILLSDRKRALFERQAGTDGKLSIFPNP